MNREGQANKKEKIRQMCRKEGKTDKGNYRKNKRE